jgi:hypothetical protein
MFNRIPPAPSPMALSQDLGNTKSAKEETQKAQISISIFLCAFCVGFALFVFPVFITLLT